MRLPLALLIAFCSSSALSQPNSVRLFGMGNVSIAVPDIEGEAFVNPAKATRLVGFTLRMKPSYLGNKRTNENSFSESVYTSSSSDEFRVREIELPVEGIISFGSLSLGGSFSFQQNSYDGRYVSNNSTTGSAPQTTSSKYETFSPTTAFAFLGGVDLTGISIGAAAEMSGTSGEDQSVYASSSSFGSSSNESKYANDLSSRKFRAGIVTEVGELVELSMLAWMSSQKSETKQTLYVSNGVPQPQVDPYIPTREGMENFVLAQIRVRFGERLLVGGLITGQFRSTDNSAKSRYYEPGSSVSAYESRKTGEVRTSSYQIGAALTFLHESRALISAEYVLVPRTLNSKTFFTTNGTKPNGQAYRRGDPLNESEFIMLSNILRVGAELPFGSALTIRAGTEIMWGSSDWTLKDYSNLFSEMKTNGETSATLYGTCGLSFDASAFRLEYALSAFQTSGSGILSSFSPSPSLLLYGDIPFRHRLALILQL